MLRDARWHWTLNVLWTRLSESRCSAKSSPASRKALEPSLEKSDLSGALLGEGSPRQSFFQAGAYALCVSRRGALSVVEALVGLQAANDRLVTLRARNRSARRGCRECAPYRRGSR